MLGLGVESIKVVTGVGRGSTGGNEGVEAVRNEDEIEKAGDGIGKMNEVGKAVLTVLDAPMQLAPLRWLCQNIGVQLLLLLFVTLLALYRYGLLRDYRYNPQY